MRELNIWTWGKTFIKCVQNKLGLNNSSVQIDLIRDCSAVF